MATIEIPSAHSPVVGEKDQLATNAWFRFWNDLQDAASQFLAIIAAGFSYSTGSWTPIDSSGAGLGLTTAVGKYTQIGNTVIAQCVVAYPVTASGLAAVIGGLPFTIGTSPSASGTYTTSAAAITAIGANATTLIALSAAAGGAAVTNAAMSGKSIVFTLTYSVT